MAKKTTQPNSKAHKTHVNKGGAKKTKYAVCNVCGFTYLNHKNGKREHSFKCPGAY